MSLASSCPSSVLKGKRSHLFDIYYMAVRKSAWWLKQYKVIDLFKIFTLDSYYLRMLCICLVLGKLMLLIQGSLVQCSRFCFFFHLICDLYSVLVQFKFSSTSFLHPWVDSVAIKSTWQTHAWQYIQGKEVMYIHYLWQPQGSPWGDSTPTKGFSGIAEPMG